jgi:phosphate acetyltransferase
MDLLQQIRAYSTLVQKCIVLPEGEEERTLQAANTILFDKLARLILLGNPSVMMEKSEKLGLNYIQQATILDPNNNPKEDFYAEMLWEIRKNKGMSLEQAKQLVKDPLYLATLLIKNREADGEVAGAQNATGDVLRPAFQIIKTLPGVSVVSGAFIMILKDKQWGEDGVLVFADCAAHPNPNERELAEIAIVTAKTAKALAKIEPRVAMLSFSTKGSAKHEMVTKVINATKIAKEIDPSIKIDGELQADAALVPKVGASKAPNSEIAGKANVLIFPNLEVGNIAYKLVQRLAGAEAVGPVMQGMAAPINDLSRGCSVEDIINMVAITAMQAAE